MKFSHLLVVFYYSLDTTNLCNVDVSSLDSRVKRDNKYIQRGNVVKRWADSCYQWMLGQPKKKGRPANSQLFIHLFPS